MPLKQTSGASERTGLRVEPGLEACGTNGTVDAPNDEERLSQARDALAGGDAMTAFTTLRPLLEFPAPDPTLPQALALFVDVATAIAGPDFGAKMRKASTFDDPQALYDAGFALYEQRLFGIAATMLTRANQLAPGQAAIVGELAAALEEEMRYGEARAFLLHSGLAETDPQIRYLLAFHQLMGGEVDEAAALLPGLRAMSQGDPALSFMADAIGAMVERHGRLKGKTPLDERDLTGWHAVLHGGLLLHESPHGHDEPMHGRYAFVSDHVGLMREGIDRLRVVLDASGIAPERVLAAEDRSSRVLARAVGTVLGIEVVPFLQAPEAPGLIVAYDLHRIGDENALRMLHPHRPGQVLFTHASAWVDPFPYAPDVTTLLYQELVVPWEGGALAIDPATGEPKPTEADHSPDEVLAQRIVEAKALGDSVRKVEDLRRIVEALGDASALRRTEGRRVHFRKGGPVTSAYFR